jgi:hypothetical protein
MGHPYFKESKKYMRILKRDVICECGHSRRQHSVSRKGHYSTCWGGTGNCKDRRKKIACTQWRPSNLLTLEWASQQNLKQQAS